ncbi:MAG: 4-hydroxy-tetrahydrodipicolinate reductase [Acidimicrobiales bacterium]
MKALAINGGAGRMGQIMAAALHASGQFSIGALVDVREPGELYGATYAATWDDVDANAVDVVIDFSSPEGVVASAQWCAGHGKGLVVGTTGLTAEQRRAVDEAATKVGVVIAANYSVGAVLSEKFAAMAAPYFERVEIIELHHDKKVDAPSGTSIAAAKGIASARAAAGLTEIDDPTVRHTVKGARGADTIGGIKIHSVRLPGLTAHQEILFGGPGEGLTIRHDSFDRLSFVQGVALAANAVDATPRLIEGIESLI